MRRLRASSRDFKAESERAMRKIKDRAEAARIKKAADNQAAELRRKVRKIAPEHPNRLTEAQGGTANLSSSAARETEEIREGDRVKYIRWIGKGIVESIRDGTYVVMIGSLRYRADRGDLERASGHPAPVPSMSSASVIADTAEETASELKVIGLTADEAWIAWTSFSIRLSWQESKMSASFTDTAKVF